ncbi:hypothetical protein L596_028588 [Steinernema carpocapsae]|uniref:Secreted protein n=1 Tax=Steinernema carpocapsae TaxID=34508 RepID=A0A4U5LYU8_STECR|nr:hypothetical protein L596_028588 [Steinernema carpocapsae]
MSSTTFFAPTFLLVVFLPSSSSPAAPDSSLVPTSVATRSAICDPAGCSTVQAVPTNVDALRCVSSFVIWFLFHSTAFIKLMIVTFEISRPKVLEPRKNLRSRLAALTTCVLKESDGRSEESFVGNGRMGDDENDKSEEEEK